MRLRAEFTFIWKLFQNCYAHILISCVPLKKWLFRCFTDESKKLFTYKGPTQLKKILFAFCYFSYMYERNPLPSSTFFCQGTVSKIILLRKTI